MDALRFRRNRTQPFPSRFLAHRSGVPNLGDMRGKATWEFAVFVRHLKRIVPIKNLIFPGSGVSTVVIDAYL